jgi:undecaprenyl pyrophosphate synthase
LIESAPKEKGNALLELYNY